METFELILVSSWTLAYVVFATVVSVKGSQRQQDMLGGFPLNELTVIIPFRNESKNLELLCNAILSQKKLPREFIFVDDHSIDQGAQLIETKLNNGQVSFKIIRLPQDVFGKKQAIMHAVTQAKTAFCQTLDADVWFKDDFFENLPEPLNAEMQILPVRMIGKTMFTKLLELEYGSFQILQSIFKPEKPLMASGANLIFKRDVYLLYNQLEKHSHRSSGDDQYALVQLIKNNRLIRTYFDLRLAVFTKTPQSFGELLRQRIRWMGNNTQSNDPRATFFALLIFTFNLIFLLSLLYCLIMSNFGMSILISVVKCSSDMLMYWYWFKRNNTWSLIWVLPLLSITYPIYLILLLTGYLILGSKVQWKSRNIAMEK